MMYRKSQREAVLCIFIKYPEPEKVKTRLIPEFSAEEAAAFYRLMAEYVLAVHAVADGYDMAVGFDPAERRAEIRSWLGGEFVLQAQEGDGLGERQLHAFRRAFAAGYRKAAILGSDCPLVTVKDVRDAFAVLDEADVVIGPAADGGYYLIGATAPHEILFREIHWGTDRVLRETLERVEESELDVRLLETRHDVDSYEDVERLWGALEYRERDGCADGIRGFLASFFTGRT